MRSRAEPLPSFWSSPAARIIAALLIVLAVVVGVRKLERINLRQQTERRLAADPALGPKVERLKGLIEKNLKSKPSPERAVGEQLAVALYFGQVGRFEKGRELHGLPPTVVLRLASPILLAGEAGKNDTASEVVVSWKDQIRGLDFPAAGEEWIVAVWRDKTGNNVAHTAERCYLK